MKRRMSIIENLYDGSHIKKLNALEIDTAWISYELVQKLQDGGEYRQRFTSGR